MSNGKNTVARSSSNESKTAFSATHPSIILTSENLTTESLQCIKGWLTSYQGDSPVSLSLSQVKTRANQTNEICGQQPSNVLASYDRDSHSWRTSQISLLTNTLDEFSEIWPKPGMIVNGELLPRPQLVPLISEKESGYWRTPEHGDAANRKFAVNSRGEPKLSAQVKQWPTPAAWDANRGPQTSERMAKKLGGPNLISVIKHREKFPTPTTPRPHDNEKTAGEFMPSQNQKDLTIVAQTGGQLNPTWVEWLMGWPPGWTDLKCLEMDGFHRWLKEFCK